MPAPVPTTAATLSREHRVGVNLVNADFAGNIGGSQHADGCELGDITMRFGERCLGVAACATMRAMTINRHSDAISCEQSEPSPKDAKSCQLPGSSRMTGAVVHQNHLPAAALARLDETGQRATCRSRSRRNTRSIIGWIKYFLVLSKNTGRDGRDLRPSTASARAQARPSRTAGW